MAIKPTIIIDSREQKPFTFSDAVQTEVAALQVGDYSLAGLTDQVVIERKSLSDLLGSITGGRERFVRELKALRRYSFAALVIESSWPEIESGQYPQQVAPAAVVGSLMSFAIRYGIIPIMAGDHHLGGIITERLLINYFNKIVKDHKALVAGAGGKGGA